MKYSRLLRLSAAGSRRAANWPLQRMNLEDFYSRLKTPVRSAETLDAYLRMPKAKQDELKDIGGYVFGVLEGGKRRAGHVQERDGVTLDADNIPPGGTEDILRRVEALGCSYVVYSTRKHRPGAPRLRIVLPLDRGVTADEYEPVARKIAEIIDPTMAIYDPTTFEPSRLMYWPSCCADSEYVYRYGDKPMLNADGILEKYTDWQDWSSWPQVPGIAEKYRRSAQRQQDPETKNGIVGAWCRVHPLTETLMTVLDGIYRSTDQPDRWSYAAGSTTGGALVYDDKFLYSHHATDPAGGQLCNSFDLCRLHLFGDRDDNVKPDTPVNRLPSYKEMCAYARSDAKVADLINTERYAAVTADLAEMPETERERSLDVSWMQNLKISESGKIEHTANNVLIMLQGDPRLKEKLQYNEFSKRIEGVGVMPWAGREKEESFEWTDNDDAGLRMYTEKLLGYRTEAAVKDALVQAAMIRSHNPLQDYLNGLVWDGVPRLDTVYIDYFGDEDNIYTREVGRKSLTAAVARAMQPGIKYDTMVVISGPQGTCKTTFVERIGKSWQTSLLVSFKDPKAVAEVLQNNWIVEIAELSSLNKADNNTVKQIITQTSDEYRAAYARSTEKHKRHSVFFGTTNDMEYLKDPTGNRRFWPIHCGPKPEKHIWEELTPQAVDQLWAEAVTYWRIGEPLILSKEAEAIAETRREEHLERDELEGLIAAFLERPVPSDWLKMASSQREMFLSGADKKEYELVLRDRICVAEIWRECLEEYRKNIRQQDSRRIARIMDRMPEWERAKIIWFGTDYGRQKGWIRKGLP